MRQQQGHDLPADKPADRGSREGCHDHRRAQPVRRIVAGQGGRARKCAADPEPGEEPQHGQHDERRRKGAEQRGDAEDRNAAQQQRLAADPVADRPGREGADQDADARPQERGREGRSRQVPDVGQGRHCPRDRIDVVAVANLDQRAERRDTDLQATDALVFERRLCRR